jgi:hypothetical protein
MQGAGLATGIKEGCTAAANETGKVGALHGTDMGAVETAGRDGKAGGVVGITGGMDGVTRGMDAAATGCTMGVAGVPCGTELLTDTGVTCV